MKRGRPTNPPPSLAQRLSIDHRSRDSDASFCSSTQPSASRSSILPLTCDRSAQSAALKSVNHYLQSISFPSFLRPPLPSARDIYAALEFLLGRLDLALDPGETLEEGLPAILRNLGCPVALKSSVLRTPSTPHAWPPILAVLQWLVQIARYADHTAADPTPQVSGIPGYHIQSYGHYIQGDDNAVEAVDAEAVNIVQQQADAAAEAVSLGEMEVSKLEERLQQIRSTPTPRQELEKKRADLMEDAKKFEAVIEKFVAQEAATRKSLEEKERVLQAKLTEASRIILKNEELRKSIDEQKFHVRDVERMKKELAAVERDIVEAEIGRNAFEEQILELDSTMNNKIKELEGLISECNQAVKRLKLGIEFQYKLNREGATAAEVLGEEYKTKLKPVLASLSEATEKTSMSKLEESISLQQQLQENVVKLEAKRRHLEDLQAQIDAAEARSALLKKEMEDYLANCAAEAAKLQEELKSKIEFVESREKGAYAMLKDNENELENAVKQSQEETKMCADELLSLIDTCSKFKEGMESKISGLRASLCETARLGGEIYRTLLSKELSGSQNENERME